MYKNIIRLNISQVFMISIFAFAIFVMGSPVVTYGDNEYSMFSLLVNRGMQAICLQTPVNNSLLVLYRFDNSKWYCLFLPIVAILPVIITYRDIDGNMKKNILIRVGYRRYCLAIMVAAFVTGCMVVCFGLLVYGITVYSVFGNIKINEELLWIMRPYGENFFEWIGLTLLKMSNSILLGGLYSSLSIIAIHYIKDYFLTITMPMMVMYVSIKLYDIHMETFYGNLSFEEITEFPKDKWALVFPSNYSDMYRLLQSEYEISYIWVFVAIPFVFIILYMFYCKVILRHKD